MNLPNYLYYLDNALVEEPEGWDSLTDKIERADDIKGIFATLEGSLTFRGDGYALLFGKFATSFCGTTSLLIKEKNCADNSYSNIYEGTIFISDCTFDYNKCFCEAKIQDNSFYAKINNNKSIKMVIESDKTKNGLSITPADDYKISIFNPCTGTYIASPRTPHAVRVFEAFRVLVLFMTDNTCEFRSSFFDVGGEAEGTCITDGIHLSGLTANYYSASRYIQKICFVDLFQEMDKKYNLGMMVDLSGAKPTLVIEQDSYFKNNVSVITMSKINSLKATIDVERLYSQIHFGGQSAIGNGCPSPGLAFPRDALFITFKDENYYLIGTCNIDKTLDLYGQWIVDSNIIQDCVVNGTEDYDDQIFIIDTEYIGPKSGICKKSSPFPATISSAVFYNEIFLNSNISLRFIGAAPSDIAQILSNLVDTFFAHRTQTNNFFNVTSVSAPVTYTPIAFNDDSTPPYNDPGGNFTLLTGRYTAVATGGIYRFFAQIHFRISDLILDFPAQTFTNGNKFILRITLTFVQEDNTATFISSDAHVREFTTFSGDQNALEEIQTFISHSSKSFVLSIGDYVYTEIKMQIINYFATGDAECTVSVIEGFYKTIYTSNGNGVLASYDSGDYPVYKFDFEYPLSRSEFNKIKAQPNYAVTLDVDGVNSFNAFVKLAKYKRKTSMAQFTCFRSLNQHKVIQ